MKIWQKYLYYEVLKVFFLILSLFFMLYVLFDYSMNMQAFSKNGSISFPEIASYYSCHFSRHLDLLLPLSLLIAIIKILTSMTQSHELLALRSSGLSLIKIMNPLFVMGLLVALILGCNFEFFRPKSLVGIEHFEHAHLKQKKVLKRREHSINVIPQEDGSRLIYRSYSPSTSLFHDLYWIISADEVWHFKSLQVDTPYPTAHFADHLKRKNGRTIEKVASYESYPLKGLHLDLDTKIKQFIPYKDRSFSEIIKVHLSQSKAYLENRSSIDTHFYLKIVKALIPFLTLLVMIPHCTSYRRNTPLFLIYTLALFGFIAFQTFLDASVILGENQVLSPLLIMIGIPACFFLFFWRKYRHYAKN